MSFLKKWFGAPSEDSKQAEVPTEYADLSQAEQKIMQESITWDELVHYWQRRSIEVSEDLHYLGGSGFTARQLFDIFTKIEQKLESGASLDQVRAVLEARNFYQNLDVEVRRRLGWLLFAHFNRGNFPEEHLVEETFDRVQEVVEARQPDPRFTRRDYGSETFNRIAYGDEGDGTETFSGTKNLRRSPRVRQRRDHASQWNRNVVAIDWDKNPLEIDIDALDLSEQTGYRRAEIADFAETRGFTSCQALPPELIGRSDVTVVAVCENGTTLVFGTGCMDRDTRGTLIKRRIGTKSEIIKTPNCVTHQVFQVGQPINYSFKDPDFGEVPPEPGLAMQTWIRSAKVIDLYYKEGAKAQQKPVVSQTLTPVN